MIFVLNKERDLIHLIAKCAVRALYSEVSLEPKPGLVSFRDNGSHSDMNASTFMRSLFSLRHYFADIAKAGSNSESFESLQVLGIEAERRMMQATAGVNTHRGAIFSLGLLCAAAGQVAVTTKQFEPQVIRATMSMLWGEALATRAALALHRLPLSNGQRMSHLFGMRSANEEAAEGLPTLFEVTFPSFQKALSDGHNSRAAKVHSLFSTMAHLDDTNVASRGGREGIELVKSLSAGFISRGSVYQSDWLEHARDIHTKFVAKKLSPGGAADLLACACFLYELQSLSYMNIKSSSSNLNWVSM